MQNKIYEIENKIIELGAHKAANIYVKDIVFDKGFRKLCQSNACGKYGKCWTCPPYAGEIEDLIEYAKSFEGAFIYQTYGLLEDSYDFEGMMAQGEKHNKITQKVMREFCDKTGFSKTLHLGAGGCRVCETCAKVTEQPCRFPHLALSNLETYGIDVSALAKTAKMNYINGQNTVTFFSGFFYKL